MARSRVGVIDVTEDKEIPKKESAPKIRGAGYSLFEQLDENTFRRIDSYPNPKAFREGVKERVRAISDAEELPNWVRFRGEFKPVKIERIKDVKVKL